MFMLSFIFAILCGLFEWTRSCAGFFSYCLFISVLPDWRSHYQEGSNYQEGEGSELIGDPIIKRGNVVSLLTGLTLPHFVACSRPVTEFSFACHIAFFLYKSVNM